MNFADHIDAAKSLMRSERLLTESDMDLAAAEMVWGAASHIVDAVYHLRIDLRGHPSNNRGRKQVVVHLDEKYRPDHSLEIGFDSAANELHNHFYTGRLSHEDLVEAMAAGRRFIARMLELADREQAELESAGGE